MAIRLIASALLGCCVAAAASAQSTLDLQAELDRAAQALADRQWQLAETTYRGLMARDPGLADAYQGLARALLGQGRAAEAAALLLEAGQGLVQAGAIATGKDFLEQALAIEPNSSALHAALGRAHWQAGEHARAVAQLERAVALGDRSVALRLVLGSALWESGQPARAERIYRELLEQDRANPLVGRSLGLLLVWQGRYAEAVAPLRAALAKEPSSLELQYALAGALAGSDQDREALSIYHRILDRAPEFTQARYRYALLLERGGQQQAAAREMAEFQRLQARQLESTDQEYRRNAELNYGWNLLREGRVREATQHFERLAPSTDRLIGLAAAHSAAGDHRAAIEALEQALLLDPGDPRISSRLLEARLAVGESW